MCTECRWSSMSHDGDVLISFEGEIDFTNAGSLRADVCRVLEHTPHSSLMVDLTEVKFIDRSGLGLLFALPKEHGERALRIAVSTASQPARMMQLGRYHRYFAALEYVPARCGSRAEMRGELRIS